MPAKKPKVFIAFSGGVDSSAAAALLMQQGYDCQAVFMSTSDHSANAQSDAVKMAKSLGIKLHLLDMRSEFAKVLTYFSDEYARGRTPNPCVFCNRYIKFGKLWEFAKQNDADFFATGHYAKIIKHKNDYGLYEAAAKKKDQSYVLSMIKKQVLPHILLPLANISKEQTIEMAKQLGLHIEGRKESQEICFIPDDDYITAIEQLCPDLASPGDIIDSDGNILGQHHGIHRYTIGQRRGLKIAMGIPYYVTKIDVETNTVTLGPKQQVMHKRFKATDCNWLIEKPSQSFRARVKVRYNSPCSMATVNIKGPDAFVEFDEQVSAITPGQLTAFYIDDDFGSRVAGSAWIDAVLQ
ncbi:MAG: tRNA 2-thiouridine(34) synthase MnmA [Planctomycetes bacterium]|nr:tRNA 2-thiouridine(34) synthase MnmA [Planctomycetota bacterium]MBL7107512.1 tRNA 2-thiouridine(34) synthase MnmA [Phycisphaerae bacterium]